MTNPAPLWNGVLITRQYAKGDGSPKQGSVTFTIPVRVVVPANRVTYPKGDFVTAPLDANGRFTVTLQASDDPDIMPNDWQYQVKEVFFDGGGEEYRLTVPISAASTGLDLSSGLPTTPTTSPFLPGFGVRVGTDGNLYIDDTDAVDGVGVQIGSDGNFLIDTAVVGSIGLQYDAASGTLYASI